MNMSYNKLIKGKTFYVLNELKVKYLKYQMYESIIPCTK